MSEDWHNRVKKLALAYETGWEYMAKSGEAGSVLTDVFLEMEGRNQGRIGRLWKKHKQEFLQVVPLEDDGVKRIGTALVVKAEGRNNGEYLQKGTKVYTILDQEGLIRFRTCSDLTLTSAKLQYGIYKKGPSAWLSYDAGENADEAESRPVRLFQAVGSELARPFFEWDFCGLCDGRERLSVAVEFCGIDGTGGNDDIAETGGTAENDSGSKTDITPAGRWSVTDGQTVYPLSLEQADTGFALKGDTPEFAKKLNGERYTVRLEFSAGHELPPKWQEALCGGIILHEAAEMVGISLCLTDEGASDIGRIKPFGRNLNEASCCYFACDCVVGGDGVTAKEGGAAGADGEIELKFVESYEVEEKLPGQPSSEYRKLYKKYPWMKPDESVRDWQAEYTIWEYFNGSLWRPLPGSGEWRTGCCPDTPGERTYLWVRPQDMQPCSVEGEIHFYIRLRLVGVRNAFVAYYRKYIPMMEKVCLEKGARILKPVMSRGPIRAEWQEEKMYLGFDRKITAENIWYTGAGTISFEQEQIRGLSAGCARQVRYGREAFWVELEGGEAQDWETLTPNYVEILQEKSLQKADTQKADTQKADTQKEDTQKEDTQKEDMDGDNGAYLQIPAATGFFVETADMETLNAVSVSDARYNGDGPPIDGQKRVEAAAHYFSHYGRLVTLYDIELLLQERYPFLKIVSCALREDTMELQISLKQNTSLQNVTKELLWEIDEWLRQTISRTGSLWLKDVNVNCTLTSGNNTHSAGGVAQRG